MFNGDKIEKLGVVVGSGNLPSTIIEECKKQNIKPYLLLLNNFAEKEKYSDIENISINLGDVGKGIKFFKKNKVKYVVFAGAVKKPDLKTIKPDLKGFFLLLKLLKCKMFGDDTLLQTVVEFLEKEKLQILPVDLILKKNIKISSGIAGKIKLPHNDYKKDIELGVKVLKQISDLDIGQSVIIQNGVVIGIECIEGTKELIKRCSEIKYNTGRRPILVKIKKTHQTKKADLPSIGKNTILEIKEAGFAGIAIDYENTLVINKEETIELANKNNIFIIGVENK